MASLQLETVTERPKNPEDYCLHVFPFSLYSIMARMTLAFGQAAVPAVANPLSVKLKLVNLHREENISEAYLTKFNAKGQVTY